MLKRLDKLTLLAYLFQGPLSIPCARLQKDDGAILILADLFLGDLGMTGHLVQHVRSHHPGRKIVILINRTTEAAAAFLDADHVVVVSTISWKVLSELRSASPVGYGWVINVFSWKWLPLLKAIPHGTITSYAHAKPRSNRLINELRLPPNEPQHATEIILSLASDNLRLPRKESATVINRTNKYVLLHVGGRALTRLWPATLLRTVLQRLSSYGRTIVLTGTRQEEPYEQELHNILRCSSNSANVINLIGKTTLRSLLTLTKNARAVVSMDTGIIHWARYFGTPNFSVLGPSDQSLFGSKSTHFNLAEDCHVDKLPCRTKKRFHGISLDWMQHCTAYQCPLEKQLCVSSISSDLLSTKLGAFLATTEPSLYPSKSST